MELRKVLPRAQLDVADAIERVRPVIEAVRERGVEAVREATARFDGVELSELRVPVEALASAERQLAAPVRDALGEMIKRVTQVHRDQRRRDVTTEVRPGGVVTERWVPVRRVGLYVPGGLAVYPSSVVMNVIPAQVAGVDSLAVTSPPTRQTGLPHSLVLAACALLGVDEVYAVGGAQAIAMFGYGAGECSPTDLITGPGNIWVTAAKRLLRGVVGVDAEAGPTEIAILADGSADPAHVAADLISQAEHDPLAAAVLITADVKLVGDVESELERQLPTAKHSGRIKEALTGSQSGVVLVKDLEHGIRAADAYAAEHLEIQTHDARAVAQRIRNAGAIFVGAYSPVSLGDYCAGSNHVLPTGGCARHTSGLSVQTFLRGIHVIDYGPDALREVADRVASLAEAEDLPAHGAAVLARFADERR